MRTFEEYLTEIGDSRKPYPYNLAIRRGVLVPAVGSVDFITDNKIEYRASYLVNLQKGEYRVDVDFTTAGKGFAMVDQGTSEAFRVMATIVNSLKEFIITLWKTKFIKADYIDWQTTNFKNAEIGNDGNKGKQRDKLYIAFAKKELPGASITTGSKPGYTSIKLPDRMFK